MLTIKVCVLLFFVILAECGRSVSRQNSGGLIKEPHAHARVGKRGEVFDNLFNIYDPSFLAVVWPKITNGLHILVDHECWEELGVFFKELTEGRAWAYSALDASGRYEAALFSGNRFWLGSKDQCLHLDQQASENNVSRSDFKNALTSGKKYFNEDAHEWKWVMQQDETTQTVPVTDRWPPHRLAYTIVQICLNITKTNMVKSYDVTIGVCMPRSCSARDISSVINFSTMINDNLKSNKTTSRTARITEVRQVLGYYDIGEDAGAILLICITVMLVALAIAATMADLDLIKCLPYGKQSMTFDLEKYNIDPTRNIEREHTKHQGDMKSEIDKLGVENANMNYMAVESMIKGAPAITLDVTCADRSAGSCKRCGKYRKQCSNPRQQSNLPPCPRLQYNSFASLSTESKRRSIFCRLFLCFSLSYCWKRVFNRNTANKDLTLIHCMRILSTFWIIFVHVAVIVNYISDNAGDINEQNNVYFILATGTIAFDTLFFVSGLFSSHHFFYLKSQYSVQELVGWGGACGQMLQFVCFVTNRVIRLLPSYAYTVLLSAVIARWSRSTSTLALPDSDHDNCNHYWWRNLLYISNIYPVKEQCMQLSWYLSTETQVHMLGALLCAASAASSLRARASVALALVAVLSATVTDASAAYFDFKVRFANAFGAYSTIIERPWARVAPYFIGVFTGWLVHAIQGKLKVSKITSSLLWVSSVSFTVASVAVSMIGLPWLAAWLHLSWSIALLWPVLMGTTNLAGMFRRLVARAPVAALSRLCYGALLLHGAVARALLLSLDSALCSTTTCVWLYFTGTTVLTILAALLLSLLVEMPCCSLLRRLSDCAA